MANIATHQERTEMAFAELSSGQDPFCQETRFNDFGNFMPNINTIFDQWKGNIGARMPDARKLNLSGILSKMDADVASYLSLNRQKSWADAVRAIAIQHETRTA